ncbi:hypothetical protein AAE478_008942 [Parahypoxylon ruwenzoriense]
MRKANNSTGSGDSGGNIWQWALSENGKQSVRKTMCGREVILEQPVMEYNCNRVEYAHRTYDALSYTWGDLTRSNEITVDGNVLGITENLHEALLNLRSPTEARDLWVDAACIDQENIQERNHQVQMMKSIFSAASSVIVWLGDAEGSVRATMEMILNYNWSKGKRDLFKYPQQAIRGIVELFRRPWWKRIWIVQEVVAAQELVVLLGRTVLPWIMLERLCREIQVSEFLSHPLAPVLHSCGYQKFTTLNNFRRNGTMPLVRFLQCTQDYQATDSRDKLYALLGMASDVTTDDIVPDYTKPVQEMFLDLVKFMATNRRNLDIISSGRLSLSNHTAPSWLPDWQGLNTLRPLNSEEPGGHFYRASSHTEAVADLAEFPSALTVKGAVVDTVEVFGSTITLASESRPTIQSWQDIAAENVNRANMWLFRRTIVMDKDHIGNLAMPSFDQGFTDFITGSDKKHSKFVQQFSDAVNRAVIGRRFFITKNGRMGLGPPEIEPKDKIAILLGCHVPLILREVDDHMVIVGEAYVSNLMNGEAMAEMVERRYGTRNIILK